MKFLGDNMHYRIKTIFMLVLGIGASNVSYSESLVRSDLSPLQKEAPAALELQADSPRQDIHQCEQQANQYGNGRDRAYVDPSCLKSYLQAASPNAVKQTDDGKLFVYASGNMIVMEKEVASSRSPASVSGQVSKKIELIAGSGTKLSKPRSIVIDSKNNEIILLNSENSILVFSSTLGGNVVPIRSFSSKSLFGATSLVVDTLKNEIIAANENGSLVFFKRLANEGMKNPNNDTSPIRTLAPQVSGIPANAIIALDQEHQEIFALDKLGQQILAIDLSTFRTDGKVSTIRTIAGVAAKIESAEAISYSKMNDQIEVLLRNADGELSSKAFRRTASGDATPLFNK